MKQFEPLTPLDEYPLHSKNYGVGVHYACTTPEQPRDYRTAYDWRCRACVIAAEAHIINQGDNTMWWTQTEGATAVEVFLSYMVERSKALLDA